MRTTIDLPATLMRAAKAQAAERSESLKDLVTRAVAHELGLPSAAKAKTGRVRLPLVGRDAAAEVLATSEDMASALEAEDIERYRAQ